MSDSKTVTERMSTWLFSIPTVAQWWANCLAGLLTNQIDVGDPIPFAPLHKPLVESTVALITTGGIHLPEQQPFDMNSEDGDPSYREIPGSVAAHELTITHKYYDHTDADRDINVIFPLDHFRSLVDEKIVGALNQRHFSFMGHIDGPYVQELQSNVAPEIAQKLRADGVDVVFLTPA